MCLISLKSSKKQLSLLKEQDNESSCYYHLDVLILQLWNSGLLCSSLTHKNSLSLTHLTHPQIVGKCIKYTTNQSEMSNSRPPVTFHVLDTGSGVPASGMLVEISSNSSPANNEPFHWVKFGECLTNSDGRGTGLLPASMKQIPVGIYKMKFHTKAYFSETNTSTFYPFVSLTHTLYM